MNQTKQVLRWRGGQLVNHAAAPAYNGASQSVRYASWNAPSSGPNRALLANLRVLRNRSRAEVRNNPWISQGISRLVSNEIGVGITPRSRAKNQELREALNNLWSKFAVEVDSDGVFNVYGMQALAARSRRTAGEVFFRRRRRSLGDGLTVPLQVQILEADFVPLELNKKLNNGNRIVAGVEFDLIGRRVAYWMFRDHPGESSGFDFNKLVRIPAGDVIHHFEAKRPGQVRGEPDTVQALPKAHDYDEYDDAELKRKKERAPYTGFISRNEHPEDHKYDPITGAPIGDEDEGPPTVDVQGGTILSGLPGENLTLFDGDNTGAGYAEYQWLAKSAISAGLTLPYEIMSGDWSHVNDRLVRAINNEFRRQIRMDQQHLDIHQVCRQLRIWFIEGVQFLGLTLPGYAENFDEYHAVEWQPEAWAYTNPEQDVNAKLKAIEGGLTSRQAEVGQLGREVEEVDRQNAEDEARIIEERKKQNLDTINNEAA